MDQIITPRSKRVRERRAHPQRGGAGRAPPGRAAGSGAPAAAPYGPVALAGALNGPVRWLDPSRRAVPTSAVCRWLSPRGAATARRPEKLCPPVGFVAGIAELTAGGPLCIGRQRCVGLLGRVLISPARWRQAKFTFEGPAECFLGFIADKMGQLGNSLSRLSQAQLGGLKPPNSEISNRRHADEGCNPFNECATRTRREA